MDGLFGTGGGGGLVLGDELGGGEDAATEASEVGGGGMDWAPTHPNPKEENELITGDVLLRAGDKALPDEAAAGIGGGVPLLGAAEDDAAFGEELDPPDDGDVP